MVDQVQAVIVTFNPDLRRLDAVLAQVTQQASRSIIIDNRSGNQSAVEALAAQHRCRFFGMERNIGLAAAQNVGISKAFEDNPEFILLVDQDSVLPNGAVRELLSERQGLIKKRVKVGSIGPSFFDVTRGELSRAWKSDGTKVVGIDMAGHDALEEVDFVIASGSLISTEALRNAGLMEAGLFIDFVDLEWGFRAASVGYRHFQSRRVVMQHALGERVVTIGSKRITLHSPIRNFFFVRNALVLSARSYIPRIWRSHFRKRVWRNFLGFGLFADARPQRLYFMSKGIMHGLVLVLVERATGRYKFPVVTVVDDAVESV